MKAPVGVRIAPAIVSLICFLEVLLLAEGNRASPGFILPDVMDVEREAGRKKVESMFYFAYEGYKNHAMPYDELMPVTCGGHTTLGNYSLTLVDALDTLAVLGNATEFTWATRWVSDNLNFDIDKNVSVFETTIRILGGLLSAHLLAIDPELELIVPPFEYRGQLLDLAVDLAERLMPAFETPTGIPYGTVNLRYGVPKGETPVAVTAGAGTLVIEFGVLSRITGNPEYENVALKALCELWARRSKYHLVGNHINAVGGQWTLSEGGIGRNIDSFYEYMLKGHVLLDDASLFEIFDVGYRAALRFLRRGPYYIDAQIDNYNQMSPVFNSLQCFWPGMQAMAGDTEAAGETQRAFHRLWQMFGGLPELFNIDTWDIHINQAGYPLRPELIESAMYLHEATGDPEYLRMGFDYIATLEGMKVECGYAAIQDVRTGELRDHMDSYYLSETLKYLYLLFDPSNRFRTGDYIFNTEGHPFRIDKLPPRSGDLRDAIQSCDKASGSFRHSRILEGVCKEPPFYRSLGTAGGFSFPEPSAAKQVKNIQVMMKSLSSEGQPSLSEVEDLFGVQKGIFRILVNHNKRGTDAGWWSKAYVTDRALAFMNVRHNDEHSIQRWSTFAEVEIDDVGCEISNNLAQPFIWSPRFNAMDLFKAPSCPAGNTTSAALPRYLVFYDLFEGFRHRHENIGDDHFRRLTETFLRRLGNMMSSLGNPEAEQLVVFFDMDANQVYLNMNFLLHKSEDSTHQGDDDDDDDGNIDIDRDTDARGTDDVPVVPLDEMRATEATEHKAWENMRDASESKVPVEEEVESPSKFSSATVRGLLLHLAEMQSETSIFEDEQLELSPLLPHTLADAEKEFSHVQKNVITLSARRGDFTINSDIHGSIYEMVDSQEINGISYEEEYLTSMDFKGHFAQAMQALDNLYYIPNEDFNGEDEVLVWYNSVNLLNLKLEISSQPDPPQLSCPALLFIDPSGGRQDLGNGFVVSSPDEVYHGDLKLNVALTVGRGWLENLREEQSRPSSGVQVRGGVPALNTILNELTYTPTGNSWSNDIVTVSLLDNRYEEKPMEARCSVPLVVQ